MDALPIEAVVPDIVRGLASHRNLVLVAEPGAGKTTRVPLVLLDAGVAVRGEILITQPRRIAARMAAMRVASLLGEPVGGRVGYQVRFEASAGPRTVLRFVTEGILARRLRADPALDGVAAVVLDEFHERRVDTDVNLALLRRLQRSTRPDLRIAVMSATLAAEPIAAYLECTPIHCSGRTHPVEIEHLDRASDDPPGREVARALRRLGETGSDGSVLVFLPGAREIREAEAACRSVAASLGLALAVLHGELSSEQQDRAITPHGPPKLILSTNIAETSVTIDGVTTVIDSGLVRRASHNPWTGLPTLTVGKISQASAIQRAGRAGRTQPGRCLRLFTRHDLERRPAYDEPEIARLDLADALLGMKAAGIDDTDALAWFEAPPPASWTAAHGLLRRLGAFDASGAVTPLGRAMSRLPIHPRLARLMLAGAEHGVPHTAAGAAALLSERPLRSARAGDRDRSGHRATAQEVAGVDAWVQLRELTAWRERRSERGLDANACRTIVRSWDDLVRHVPGRDRASDPESALAMALLHAFPDRVARRRPGTDELVFADGGSAVLAHESVVRTGELVVAVAATEQREGTRGPRIVVQSAAEIEPEWLLDALADHIEEHVDTRFDEARERVQAIEELRYGALVIERRVLETPPAEATAVLWQAARERGPAAFVRDPEALGLLERRTAFAHRFDARIPVVDEARVLATLERLCLGCHGFAELRAADLLGTLEAELPSETRSVLERLAPRELVLANGRRLRVHYELDRDPWVASRLQDFFGRREGPTVADGRVPVVVHLLAPNGRPIQITTDLAGFWSRHYPELRRALMRRYPKHAWPDDPLHAEPPRARAPR